MVYIVLQKYQLDLSPHKHYGKDMEWKILAFISYFFRKQLQQHLPKVSHQIGKIWWVWESPKVSQRSAMENYKQKHKVKSTYSGAKMCQKAKEDGQFAMNCPSVSNHYKKDLFAIFVYRLEPSAHGFWALRWLSK